MSEGPQEPLSSQEELPASETLVEIPRDSIPARCRSCRSSFMAKDLTACPICGSSSVAKMAVMHYAEPCEQHQHDNRFPVSKRPNDFDTVHFRIACQPDATLATPRPAHITTELRYVTCPLCLRSQEVRMDQYGRIEKLGDD